jgi:hypothetical protein
MVATAIEFGSAVIATGDPEDIGRLSSGLGTCECLRLEDLEQGPLGSRNAIVHETSPTPGAPSRLRVSEPPAMTNSCIASSRWRASTSVRPGPPVHTTFHDSSFPVATFVGRASRRKVRAHLPRGASSVQAHVGEQRARRNVNRRPFAAKCTAWTDSMKTPTDETFSTDASKQCARVCAPRSR